MGINIGGLIGPLRHRLAADSYGFHVGFGAAAVGMAIGLVIYSLGRKQPPGGSAPRSQPPPREGAHQVRPDLPGHPGGHRRPARHRGRQRQQPGRQHGLRRNRRRGGLLVPDLPQPAGHRPWSAARDRVHPDVHRIAGFWALFQQQFTFIAVYSQERLDRNLFGWEMPAAWVQSINPVFIIIFAGVMAALWTKLGSKQPSRR